MHSQHLQSPILLLMVVVFTLFGFSECGNDREANQQFDLAENILTTRPDSALMILDGIDSSRLKSSKIKARYALLKAMAIDKNGVDTTNLELIQPAIKYYLKNGNADEKLRTYYYLGRIYQNQGNYEDALGTFIRGKELLPIITDTLVMANLLTAESAILYELPDFYHMLANRIKAAELYGKIGKKSSEIRALGAALNICAIKSYKNVGDSIYSILTDLLISYPEYKEMVTSNLLSYLINFGTSATVVETLQEARNLDNIDEWTLKDIAYGYNALGDNVNAKQWLGSIPKDGEVVKQPVYYQLKADILDGLGDYKGALEAHRQLLEVVENNYEATTKQDIYFSQKRYETEIANLNALRKRERIIWVSVIAGLVLIVVAFALYRRYRYAKEENRRQEREIELLREKHSHAVEVNKKLQADTENLQSAKEKIISKLESERQEKTQLQMALILTEHEHKRLLKEKEEIKKAMEAAEADLENERKDVELYRLEKEAAEANLAKEREALEAQIKNLECESANLTQLLKETNLLSPEVKKAAHARLGILHNMIASQITKDTDLAIQMEEEKTKLPEDRTRFMDETRLVYTAANPRFIRYLQEHGLTDTEIGCACLYIIGLNGKQVANYLDDKRHYHMSSDIRKKIGLPQNANNLAPRLRTLYNYYLEKY